MRRRRIWHGGLALALTISIGAQDAVLQVSVTSSVDGVAVIDHGRNSGLLQGMRVRLFPPDGVEFEGVIRSVAPDNARIDVPEGIEAPPVGTPGEVMLPAAIRPEESDDVRPEDVPEHPPWKRRLEVLGPDVPLLAPIKRERAEDRPRDIDGRVFFQYDFTRDRGNGRESDFYVGRSGLTFRGTNLFKLGGRLKFSGQGSIRGSDIEGLDSDSETRLRLDRLSYEIGGHDYSAYRAEIGRFYSYHVPELGLIDGVEGALLYNNGLRLGGGAGFFPLPYPRRQSGDDYGLYVFADYRPEREDRLTATLAYQRTWHEGEPDRDLVVGRLSLRPRKEWWLSGSFKADVYSSGDTIKNESIGLTSLFLQARYTPSRKAGLSLSLSHFSWPELLREEFSNLPDELVRDGRVDRAEVSGWYRLDNNFRLTGRLNYWNDQDDDGSGGQLGFDWTNALVSGLSLHSSVRFTEGSFNRGVGFRATARKTFRSLSLFTEYDAFRYETQSLSADDEHRLRETLRGGIDWHSSKWYLNFNANYYFGDNNDSVGLGFFTEYRF